MKNRFTSFYMVIFLFDCLLTVVQSIFFLMMGTSLFEPTVPKVLRGILSFGLLPLAVIQIIIYFKQRLKISALMLGISPLAIALISATIGLYFFMVKKIPAEPHEFAHTLHIYMLVGGIVQLLIGIWAARDLSEGHSRSGIS